MGVLAWGFLLGNQTCQDRRMHSVQVDVHISTYMHTLSAEFDTYSKVNTWVGDQAMLCMEWNYVTTCPYLR